jgi:4'-phosphopantetheinyl transferase
MPAVTSTQIEPVYTARQVDLSLEVFPTRPLALDEVHVFLADLDAPLAGHLSPLLSEDETERAKRFVFPRGRNNFIVARGLLRKLLAGYLQCLPNELRFVYGPKGKPALPGNPIRFNLAHSHQRVLYGFSRDRELGIDLEYVDRKVEYERLAERFFAPSESAGMCGLAEEPGKEAFFRCWTRKEAYIKALGDGLSIPLDQFTVSFGPDEPAALLTNNMAAEECARWSMHSLAIETDYIAALVVEGHSSSLSFFDGVTC